MTRRPRTLAEYVARTNERRAARAAGQLPAARSPLPVLAACPHLGERVPGQPCGSPLMRCNLHGDVTVRVLTSCVGADRSCVTCPDRPAHKST